MGVPGAVARGRGMIRRLFALVVGLAICLGFGAALAQLGDARDAAPAEHRPTPGEGVPIVFEGKTFGYLFAPLGAKSPEDRARAIEARLERLAKDPTLDVKAFSLNDIEGATQVLYKDEVFLTLTDEDARIAGATRAQLAGVALSGIREALDLYREDHSAEALWNDALFVLLSTLVLILGLRGTRWLFGHLERKAARWQGAILARLKLKALEPLARERQALLISTFFKASRWLVIILFIFAYLTLVLRFFPWTRDIASALIHYTLTPLSTLWQGFLTTIPDLLFIVVVIILARFLLGGVKFLFEEAARGGASLLGIDAEWALAVYKIVRFLIIAFVAIVIFPHIPGSDTLAFKGVAVFLGALVSLGSSSAMNNFINGLVLMGMHAYRVGDWVRIGETEGEVEGTALLTTTLRTAKNVTVVLPSSAIVGGQILNYSALAREGRLVLHTTVTIGYDAPWRTVHGLLIQAALATRSILADPAPFVLQTSLDDSYVSYQINACTRDACDQPRIYGELHENIQEAFNGAGVEIMSPSYHAVRDGNAVTVPEAHRPRGYEVPAFGVEVRGQGAGEG